MADDKIQQASLRIPPAPEATTTAPRPAAKPAAADKGKPAATEPKDLIREILETVVFVVVLVFLLKSFVAEAFVIPTGSMATTLYGFQQDVTCPQCGVEFPVNCNTEAEKGMPVVGCTCPNCLYAINYLAEGLKPACHSGDRVLVAKFLFDIGLKELKPYDVVVFKFPEQPQRQLTAMNYIKRLIGLPGQTIAIWKGDIYVTDSLQPTDGDLDSDLPLRRRMYKQRDFAAVEWNPFQKVAQEAFKASQFQILRKSVDKIPAMARPVWDNDHQPKDLIGKQEPRWASPGGWTPDDPKAPRVFRFAGTNADEPMAWLRYRHLLRTSPEPQLVRDYMGYNTALDQEMLPDRMQPKREVKPMPETYDQCKWVGDLILECTLQVERADGELVLELIKGGERFQVSWGPKDGLCILKRGETELASKLSKLNKPGTYQVRFANVDNRLTLWLDGDLVFGDGLDYIPPAVMEPTESDKQPAAIGVKGGAVTVSKIKLLRDTYYRDGEAYPFIMYVQPGHYLCLGDNSPASSDSRIWAAQRPDGRPIALPNGQPDHLGGLVPEDLMLGRALAIYWPLSRFGRIR
jgi:signal peptidase I